MLAGLELIQGHLGQEMGMPSGCLCLWIKTSKSVVCIVPI